MGQLIGMMHRTNTILAVERRDYPKIAIGLVTDLNKHLLEGMIKQEPLLPGLHTALVPEGSCLITHRKPTHTQPQPGRREIQWILALAKDT